MSLLHYALPKFSKTCQHHFLHQNTVNSYLKVVSFKTSSVCCNYEDRGNKSQHKNEVEEIKKEKEIKMPEEPQNCCMSGCANCVWIAYAEELASLFEDGGETAKQKIMEHVKDPNLRTFLMMELDHVFRKKNS